MTHRRALTLITLALAATLSNAQTPAAPKPPSGIPDYPGVRTQVPGLWLPPVPNIPFKATVDILTHEKLPDGSERIRTTTNHIARSSSGRIYNERRLLVPATFKGLPPLLSAHIYDPATRLSIMIEPQTRLAKEAILSRPPRLVPGEPLFHLDPNPGPGRTEEDLGTQVFQGYTLQGIRKTRAIGATTSDTGKLLVISDEYWFSPDLNIYLIIKHNDPRTGEQLITLSSIERQEPEATIFAIPADFKVVDETPPPATATR